MFVYFSELQTRGNDFRGPDTFVVLGTDKTKERLSWMAWEEGGKLPDVVIEILSESTEHVDRGEKMRIYERVWRTGHYFLYDPFTHALEGYVLNAGRYERLTPDARGDLLVSSMELSVGVRLGDADTRWLRWIDAGEVHPYFASEIEAPLRARMDAETARADAETARADAAEARLAELERRTRG